MGTVIYKDAPESRWVHQWTPPKGSATYFLKSSDMEFQAAHPVGYVFLILLGISALLLPLILFAVFILSANPEPSSWFWLGEVGAFIIGVGLFNFVAIIIKQYLGHLVSILSFLIGGIMVAISLHML